MANVQQRLNRNAITQGSGASSPMMEADQAIYGALNMDGIGAGRITAKSLSIYEIVPDALQPRRALPSAVRVLWDGTPVGIQSVLNGWWEKARDGESVSLPLRDLIAGSLDIEDETTIYLIDAPIATGLFQLAQLAASIYRDSLTNPITVAAVTGGYRIETGERRWLAYHLLYWVTGDDKWTKIPARVMSEVNVWRQASENAARQDLNAIGRARQLALLIMSLYASTANFQPMNAFQHERDFYAQVADGEAYRLPRGTSGQVLAAMGLSDARQIRQYRALLRLERNLWVKADDENWAEGHIRQVIADTATTVAVLTGKSKTPPPPPEKIATDDDKKLFKKLLRLDANIGDAEPRLKKSLLAEVEKGEVYLKRLRDTLGG